MKTTKVFKENLKAYKEGYRVIVNKGSSRSGKSYGIIQLNNFIAEESKKHIKTSFVSQTFPHLKDGIIYDYSNILRNEGINPDNPKIHNKGDHAFKRNKSVINYFSADDSGKVMGPARDNLYLNEPNKGVSFEIYNQLKIRTNGTIWLDYNPSGKFWLHTEGIINDPRTKVIHSTWLDNIENLTKPQIQDFLDAKRKSKNSEYWNYWWKVYGLGEDAVMLEERIMPFLKRFSEVPKDAIEIPSGLDFGFFPDPTVYVRMWVRKTPHGDELYIKQEVYKTRLSINTKSDGQENLTDLIKHQKNHLIIAESAEPRNITEMRKAGFNIIAVKKTSVETSIKLFHDYIIHIVDGSEEIYEEFDNFKYARNKQTNEITGIPEKDQPDHGVDSCRYVLLSRGYRWQV